MSDNESNTQNPPSRQIMEVPRIAASSFYCMSNGNDVLVLCSNAFPGIDSVTGEVLNEPMLVTTAVLALSLAATKDLVTVLGQHVESHEQAVGPITTPYSNKQAPGTGGLLLAPRNSMSRA